MYLIELQIRLSNLLLKNSRDTELFANDDYKVSLN
jgi:hypothetical protein